MNNTNYFEKYLKYKNKYIELKKLSGGTPNTKHMIFVATHSYRLQCILNSMRIHSNKKDIDIKRFKNCAVVRVFRNGNNTQVQLIFEGIYDGLIDPNDITHFEQTDRNKVLFTIDNTYFLIPKNVEIYFIRHGEGIHNTTPHDERDINARLLIDAKLTKSGKQQALKAGNYLNEYLNEYLNGRQIDNQYYFCASDLHRTHETIGYIKHVLNNNKKGNGETPIYIISCIHEIDSKSNIENCDLTGNSEPSVQNISKCIHNLNGITVQLKNQHTEDCKYVNIKIGNNPPYRINLDWSKYNIHRTQCHTKNIIQQILEAFGLNKK
jgi:hypothetical protein